MVYDVPDAPFQLTVMHSFPFHGKSLLAVSGDDYLYALPHTEEFKIDVYNPQSEHIRTIEYPFDNVPLDRDELLERYERTNYMEQLGEGVALNMIRQADNLPETWPALEEMVFDDKDRLWISTIMEDFDVYEWWVLEETGEVFTRFEWPRNEPIEVVRNGYMYTRETDEETGLQQVVRYRIEYIGQ